jgi:hypothetical protein
VSEEKHPWFWNECISCRSACSLVVTGPGSSLLQTELEHQTSGTLKTLPNEIFQYKSDRCCNSWTTASQKQKKNATEAPPRINYRVIKKFELLDIKNTKILSKLYQNSDCLLKKIIPKIVLL